VDGVVSFSQASSISGAVLVVMVMIEVMSEALLLRSFDRESSTA
jgi:hypothetical protein